MGARVLDFKKPWFEEIAEITQRAEFQTCEIEIVDTSKIETEWNFDTREYDEVFLPGYLVYSGQARLIAVRRGVNYEGATQHNSKVITAIRVQIPHKEAPIRLRKSFSAKVTSAPHNPTLETYVFTLASDVHGSSAATRTLEFNLDGDSVG